MRAATIALGLLLAASAFAPVAQAEPFDRLVPDNTIFYLSIENIARTRERFKASPLNALWNDEAVKAFTKIPRQKWAAMMDEMKKQDGITVDDIFGVVAGRVTVAITNLGADGEEPNGVMLADIGDNAAAVMDLIKKAETIALEGDKYRRLEEEFRGVTIVHYRSTADSEEAAALADQSGPDPWFLDGNIFATGARVEDLKQALAMRGDAEAATLANHEAYRRVLARTGERSDLVMYVGARALMKELQKGPLKGDMEQRVADALGFNTLEAVGLQASLGNDGFGIRTFLSIPGAKEGIFRMFAGKNSALTPPKWVPGDVLNAMTMTLDVQDLWNEIRKIVGKIDPNAIAQMDAGLEMAKGMLGVDIQKDLIGALGKEFTMFVKPQPAAAEGAAAEGAAPLGPALPGAVFAMEVTDKAKLEGALGGLMMMAQQQGLFRSQDYLGVKMWAPNAPGFPSVSVLPNNNLVIAMHLEDLKDIIRRHGKEVKGLLDAEDFGRTMQRLPEGRICCGFSREARALRESSLLKILELTGQARKYVDLSLFPKTEVLEKYLDNGAISIVNDEGGVSYTYFLGLKAGE